MNLLVQMYQISPLVISEVNQWKWAREGGGRGRKTQRKREGKKRERRKDTSGGAVSDVISCLHQKYIYMFDVPYHSSCVPK